MAYIDGRLYFTNNPEHKSLNDRWAGGTMYSTRVSNPTDDATLIDTKVDNNKTVIFFLGEDDPMEVSTRELGGIIEDKGKRIVEKFVAHCQANPGEVMHISYQDEHLKSVLGIILTLQTIEHFVKEMGCDFDLEYRVERYEAENGKRESVTANQPSSHDRDVWLTNLTNSWLGDVKHDLGLNGELIEVHSAPRRSLTHWRVLSFEYKGKKLSIYPDGGFFNGWNISPNNPRYDVEYITHDTEVNLQRTMSIKFGVTIEG